jgi:hypothetical protein
VESFGYPCEIYQGYRVERRAQRRADTVAFVGRPRIHNRDYVLSFQARVKHFSAASSSCGEHENFRVVAWADHHRQRRAPSAQRQLRFDTTGLNGPPRAADRW